MKRMMFVKNVHSNVLSVFLKTIAPNAHTSQDLQRNATVFQDTLKREQKLAHHVTGNVLLVQFLPEIVHCVQLKDNRYLQIVLAQ